LALLLSPLALLLSPLAPCGWEDSMDISLTIAECLAC
jgi:hypothetical protein